MKIVSTGSVYRVYSDDLTTYDRLPAGTYDVCFGMMQGFYLTKKDDFHVGEKVYGSADAKAAKVLASFGRSDRNLGVILSGNKGIGKSLTAKLIAEKAVAAGLPVLVVGTGYSGIAGYLSSISQEAVVLFDEFDKTFRISSKKRSDDDSSSQDELLTMFDGLDQGKKLFVVTCNELRNISDCLINRPGRFHYHIRFECPSADEIREYLRDKLPEDKWGDIEDVVRFACITDVNYDCLRAIAFELSAGSTFSDAVKDLNITKFGDEPEYDVVCVLSDGSRSIKRSEPIDVGWTTKEIVFHFPKLRDSVTVEFDPSMRSWSTQDMCDVCLQDTMMNVYWSKGASTNEITNTGADYYEPNDYAQAEGDTRAPMPAVTKLLLKRRPTSQSIHYVI